ncbi:MAG: hypothetical protein RJA49_1773 [Actinomycetota bacterium]
MPRPRASVAVRAALYLLAIGAVGAGVSLMVEAHLGVAPNDVLNTGLAEPLGMGVGTAAWITGVAAMLLAWALGRRPLVPTILGSVVVGLVINGGVALLPTPDLLAVRTGFLLFGLALIWAGITAVVAADVGAGPLELVMLGLMDRGVGIRIARWGIELTLVTLGLLLGGAAGLGTVLFAFCTGPVLAVTLPRAVERLGTNLSQPTEVACAGP